MHELEHTLWVAAGENDSALAKSAIDAGADINHDDCAAMRYAVAVGSHEVVNLLFAAGLKMPTKPLLPTAAFYGRLEIVKQLLGVAPDVGLAEALKSAAIQNHADVAAHLLATPHYTPVELTGALKWALINDARSVIRLLVAAGATVEAFDLAREYRRRLFNPRVRELNATIRWTEALLSAPPELNLIAAA